MRNLSGYEKETIITWNEAEATAHIFTYSRSWQRHLEGKLGLHPETDNGCGGKEYQLDKRLIRLPQPKRRLSEATRQRLADNLAATRKGNLSAKNPMHWRNRQRKAVVNSPAPLDYCTGEIRHWNKDSGSRVAVMGKAKQKG